MKLIIDIDEEMISLIKDKSVECFNVIHYGQVLDAIYNGIPIPDNATVCDIEQIRAEIDKFLENEGFGVSYRECITQIIDRHTKGE